MPSARLVPHVVVFSELSPRARALYTRFLLENDVKLEKRQSDGRYVANVSLIVPEVPPSPLKRTSDTVPNGTLQRDKPDTLPTDDGSQFSQFKTDSSETCSRPDESTAQRFRVYDSFIRQVGARLLERRSSGTYVTSESKLVRLINDIYDARTDDLGPDKLVDEGSTATTSTFSQSSMPFAAFVHLYLKNRFGLIALVELQALELIEGLDAHKSRLDVELFIQFLTGHYNETALVFFFRARDAVQNEVAMARALFRPTSTASARRRRSDAQRQRRGSSNGTSLVWLSMVQVDRAAQAAFGSKNEDSYLKFVHNAQAYIATLASRRAARETLEVQEFLVLAMRTHIDTVQCGSERAFSISSASGHDGHEDSEISPCPSPLPPPPPPRALGSLVRLPVSQPTVGDRFRRTEATCPSFVLHARPVESSEVHLSDDTQSRLSSLLKRMEKRQAAN